MHFFIDLGIFQMKLTIPKQFSNKSPTNTCYDMVSFQHRRRCGVLKDKNERQTVKSWFSPLLQSDV